MDPRGMDVFLGGGRGGAKSYTLAVLALRHAEQYGAKARDSLHPPDRTKAAPTSRGSASTCSAASTAARCASTRRRACSGFPNGGTLEVNQLEGAEDYAKYQGRSFTLLLIDEAGQYPMPDLLDRLRSNLRGPAGLPIRACSPPTPATSGTNGWPSATCSRPRRGRRS